MIFSTQQRNIRHFSGGTVAAFYDHPMLESHGWRERITLDRALVENSYPQDDTFAR